MFFLVSMCGFLATALGMALEKNQGWALLVAALAGVLLWYLERRGEEQNSNSRAVANKKLQLDAAQGSIAAIGSIVLFTFVVCLPTLKTWFLTDDFAMVHSAYHFTPAAFLQLLHMDSSQFVRGEARQEFRPLYSLFYAVAFRFWGLQAWGYHVCQIALHATVAVLVFLTAKAVAPGKVGAAWFAAMLFAAQPLQGQATSLIVCAVAESLPAALYLLTFLFFVRFRCTGRLLHVTLSTAAFAACLLTKESAVTLPLMLSAYDVLGWVMEEKVQPAGRKPGRLQRWRLLLWPYVPYGILLSTYLAWRHRVLQSYLRESNWAGHAREDVASPVSLSTHLAHFVSRMWGIQMFNLETFFPYSFVALGLALGFVVFWAFSLFRKRNCTRSTLLVLFFGVAWYAITNLPYLIENQVTYHLYLPAVGVCIGVAILAMPDRSAPPGVSGYARLTSMALLLILGVIQIWTVDAEYRKDGDLSAQMRTQLDIVLKSIPQNRWVVIWPGNSELVASGWGEEILPFSAEPPFASSDLYANLRVIDHPDMSCCGMDTWWQQIGPQLSAEYARPSNEDNTMDALSWDAGTDTFQHVSRVIPRKVFVDCITAVLGGPPESIDPGDEDKSIRLVKALTDLVIAGPTK